MLQPEDLSRRARAALSARGLRTTWSTLAELEALADGAVTQLRALRTSLAATPRERLSSWLDRRLDTDATEYLDRPGHPQADKLRQVRLLHGQNRILGVYHRYLDELRPALTDAASRRTDGRARVLELACGSGELTLELARIAARRGPPMVITGSDVIDAYIEDGNRRAKELDLRATFRKLDAFRLDGVEPGEIDVAFIAQSTHHFSPGQLAKMIARVGAIGARHFISIDGYRSLLLLGVLPMLAAVTLDRYHTHDALLSARRMHAEAELALIAELAAPGAKVEVHRSPPGFSILSVEYGGAPS
jgi:SAM-dependent methyltransferase